jgi:hypothetical protein
LSADEEGMRLAIYRSLWGYPGPVDVAARQIAEASYDGIEAVLPAPGPERSALAEALRAEDLGYIPLLLVEGSTPAEQLGAARALIEEAMSLGPDRIVMHAGRDWWPMATSTGFYEDLVAMEAEIGIEIAHETHRSRPLATPWATAQLLEAVPPLRLCGDFSHWVVVCDRLLEDQEEALRAAARRTVHLHTRVGTAESPQVFDPSDPIVGEQLAAFERWWDLVWAAQVENGVAVSTMTPEYGPPPYQPLMADEAELPASLAAACDWQAERARSRFRERYG